MRVIMAWRIVWMVWRRVTRLLESGVWCYTAGDIPPRSLFTLSLRLVAGGVPCYHAERCERWMKSCDGRRELCCGYISKKAGLETLLFLSYILYYKLSPKSSRNFSIRRCAQFDVGSKPPIKKRNTFGSYTNFRPPIR